MNIYPSTTEGQVCIINHYGTGQAVSLSLGNVFNQRIYSDNHEVIFLEGNYAGVAGSRNQPGVNVYRLFAPAEVRTRAFWRDWPEGYRVMEQFNAAGCIAFSSN